MSTSKAKGLIERILSSAGIMINGKNPWDVQVHNERFFSKILTDGSLGAGETYVDHWWDCLRLDEFYFRVLRSNIENSVRARWRNLTNGSIFGLGHRRPVATALRVNKQHYDLGNDLFSLMLDTRMMYSCAYWKEAASLEEAQEKKLDLTCTKLYLQPGMHVLDIGCGWGGFAKFAAERYNVQVTGITTSEEQVRFARKICAGLPVDIQLLDYHSLRGKYDRIASLGMFEHVGPKNYRTYMTIAHECLKDGGLFLLHCIGSNVSGFWTDPWLNKYIFPGTVLPSIKQIGDAIEGLFVMEDWHNFGANYDKTLMAWHENFNMHWPKLESSYGDKFYRIWNYYLLSCAGSFRARKNQLWQIVLSKRGVPGGYISCR